MKTMSLSLVSILSLGVVLAGGRAIGGGRASPTPRALNVEVIKPALAPANRLWYGGTLAPIVVEGVAPARLSTHSAPPCANRRT